MVLLRAIHLKNEQRDLGIGDWVVGSGYLDGYWVWRVLVDLGGFRLGFH